MSSWPAWLRNGDRFGNSLSREGTLTEQTPLFTPVWVSCSALLPRGPTGLCRFIAPHHGCAHTPEFFLKNPCHKSIPGQYASFFTSSLVFHVSAQRMPLRTGAVKRYRKIPGTYSGFRDLDFPKFSQQGGVFCLPYFFKQVSWGI